MKGLLTLWVHAKPSLQSEWREVQAQISSKSKVKLLKSNKNDACSQFGGFLVVTCSSKYDFLCCPLFSFFFSKRAGGSVSSFSALIVNRHPSHSTAAVQSAWSEWLNRGKQALLLFSHSFLRLLSNWATVDTYFSTSQAEENFYWYYYYYYYWTYAKVSLIVNVTADSELCCALNNFKEV